MIVDAMSLLVLVALSALFATLVSAVALTAAIWYICASLWTRIGGRCGL